MPWQKELYPPNWREISLRIRERDGGRCKFCGAENGKPHPVMGYNVILIVTHLNHNIFCNTDDNLAALCNACYGAWQMDQGMINVKLTRQKKKDKARRESGQGQLL